MEDSNVREVKIVRAERNPEKQTLARQMRRTMTEAEACLWQRLRNNQVDDLHFRRQQVIGGFIVDFYYRAARLVIECDGAVHSEQADYDRERDQILTTHNLCVLRFANERILNDLSTVLQEILTAAKPRRSPRGTS